MSGTKPKVIAMSRSTLMGGTRRRTIELAAAASVTLLPSLAHAHFNLQAPPNWTTETSQGSPQKDWPCGNEPTMGMAPPANGPTTAFKAGDKIMIKIAETVMHPGHYRVALATSGDMNDLPKDMSADASGGNCQNDDMQATPMFPILADGMLEHDTAFSGAQTFEVTLPSDVSCDKCVLQVREYMRNHGNQPETASGQAAGMNGCYYHHCAFISISGGSGAGGMSGSGGASSAGAGGTSGGMTGQGGMPAQSGMGGAMGEAGKSMSAGAPGSAGGGSGGGVGVGGTGAAGMSNASGASAGTGGGTTGTGGSNAGATGTGGTGTGGTGTGTGGTGTSGSPGASGGTNSAPASSPPDDKGGCSYRAPARSGSGPLSVAALGFGLWLARRRRR